MPESGITLPSGGPTLRSFLANNPEGNPREHQGLFLCDAQGRIIDTLTPSESPTTTTRGLAVAPIRPRRPVHMFVTTEITLATTVGVKELVTLWHPSTQTKEVRIFEIGVSFRVLHTAGTMGFELQFISGEAGTPGGATITPQALNRGDVASPLVVRQVVTAAPTVTGSVFQRAVFPLPSASAPVTSNDGFTIFEVNDTDMADAIFFRGSQAEGLRITANVAAALTTAPIMTLYVKYMEL